MHHSPRICHFQTKKKLVKNSAGRELRLGGTPVAKMPMSQGGYDGGNRAGGIIRIPVGLLIVLRAC